MKIAEIWFKGTHTKEEREAKRQKVIKYREAYEELAAVLKTLRKPERDRNYSDPNWHIKQIASNEFNACLDEVLKIITPKGS